ncbi:MAG: phosphonate ABC transporter ATP-binding protein [Desulfocurvibacter africanus]
MTQAMGSAKGSAAIRIKDMGKVYPDGTRALSEITLTIPRRDFVAIIGSSGAGKSTLLRCINRLVRPTEGKLYLFDEEATHVSGSALRRVRQRVGMIFQQFHLVRRLSVLENVLVGRLRFNCSPACCCLTLLRCFPKAEKENAFECLKQVGIADLAFKRADELSGGQQQRVAIARALAQGPEIFLADEPIASLDPRSAEVVMETLQRIHEERHIPVLVNLHHIDFARRYGKRVLGVRQGRVVFDGTSRDLDEELIARIYGPKIREAFGEVMCA